MDHGEALYNHHDHRETMDYGEDSLYDAVRSS